MKTNCGKSQNESQREKKRQCEGKKEKSTNKIKQNFKTMTSSFATLRSVQHSVSFGMCRPFSRLSREKERSREKNECMSEQR